MTGPIRERIRTAFGLDAKPDERGDAAADGGTTTALYECADCETTYISETMDACPSCDAPVERVPSESDLGLLPRSGGPR